MAKNILVEAVKAHALDNYDTNGWDVVVECWADDEIEEVIVDCTTEEEAITAMRDEIAPFAAYRADIQGTAF